MILDNDNILKNGGKLCSTSLSLVLGVLANVFILVIMLRQQWRSGGVKTVAIIICFISLGNILLQISTFARVASLWARVLCLPDLPLFFCILLFVWLSSSSVSFWSVAWLSVLYGMKVLMFSTALFRAPRENISSVLNITLNMTLLTSCVMFTPFLYLQFQKKNRNDGKDCITKPVFPIWVDFKIHVNIFICYLTLTPLMIILPMSLRLVIYLCRHILSMKKQSRSKTTKSYLLVCRLTVALVWVNLMTLPTISIDYFHAICASGLSADIVFLGFCSNKKLRDKLGLLLCRGKRGNAPGNLVDCIIFCTYSCVNSTVNYNNE
uniref:Taste receptor type 2 n=1 Tax=Mola mola TaxID=94237 RepID=A0A3Q3WNM0_MOLML